MSVEGSLIPKPTLIDSSHTHPLSKSQRQSVLREVNAFIYLLSGDISLRPPER